MMSFGSGRTGGRGRSMTPLPKVTSQRVVEEKLAMEIDPRSSTPSGPYAKMFRSYLGILAKTHVSIVIPT